MENNYEPLSTTTENGHTVLSFSGLDHRNAYQQQNPELSFRTKIDFLAKDVKVYVYTKEFPTNSSADKKFFSFVDGEIKNHFGAQDDSLLSLNELCQNLVELNPDFDIEIKVLLTGCQYRCDRSHSRGELLEEEAYYLLEVINALKKLHAKNPRTFQFPDTAAKLAAKLDQAKAVAKFSGLNAFKSGSIKQKNWATEIRSNITVAITPEEVAFLNKNKLASSAKFWIDNRTKSLDGILKTLGA